MPGNAMTISIQTAFQGPGFVAVPNEFAQEQRLSLEARGLLIWFAAHPEGFHVTVNAVREANGIGKDKWQRIARELRAVGALENVKIRSPKGTIIGEVLSVRWPEYGPARQKPENPAAGVQKPGKPAAGKPGHNRPENPPNMAVKPGSLNNKKKKKDGASSRSRSDAAAVSGAGRTAPASQESAADDPPDDAFYGDLHAIRCKLRNGLPLYGWERSFAVDHGLVGDDAGETGDG